VNEGEGFSGWVLSGILGIVTTMAGIIAMFYRTQIADYKSIETSLKQHVDRLEKRADKCEEDRETLRIDHAVLKSSCAVLEARVTDLEKTKQNRDSVG